MVYPFDMNTPLSSIVARRRKLAGSIALAALLLTACASPSTSNPTQAAVEQPVTYAQLHRLMVKIAAETPSGARALLTESIPSPAIAIPGASALTVNQ